MKKQTQSGAIISLTAPLNVVAILFLLISMQSAKAFSIMSSSSTLKRATTAAAAIAAPRIELFFSSTEELRKRITLLKSKGVTSFNLVNKSNRDDILQSVHIIQEEFQNNDDDEPAVSVCAHYSMKYNKSRKKDGAFLQLKDYVEQMNKLTTPENNEILFITGSGPKGKLCSMTALQRLQQESISISPSVAVAFNPFFPNPKEYEEEVRRLKQKLDTGVVSKVYLQFGADLEKLQSALQMLTTLQSTPTTQPFEICGSIFLPTKQLIAQQKFRPWNGVFLNDEFLSSPDGARRIVLQMMRLYEEHSAEILIEAPGVRSEKDWCIVESLLKERDELMSSKVETFGESGKSDEKVGKVGRDDESNITTTTSTTSKRRKTSPTVESLPSSTLPAEVLNKPAIVLFHSHDVRLHDNVALQLASHHQHVIPVFLWSKEEQGPWGVRGCLEVVLKDALCNLGKKLNQFDLKLVCREGDDSSILLRQICEECNAGAVYWNKEHTTESRVREENYRTMLKEINVQSIECQSSLLYDPTSPSLTAGFHGGHWGTLIPFLRTCQKQLGMPRRPIPRSDTFFMLEQMNGPLEWPASQDIGELNLAVINGKERWDQPILDRFPMSEEAAVVNMNTFFQSGFTKYERDRSRADLDWSTSKLSAHLRIGSLSPNELYYKIEDSNLDYNDRKTFSRRLIWRDLAYFHLHSFPNMRDTSIRLHYEQTEWVSGEEEERRFHAWKTGTTGYPLVDAGMRELWKTGWMTQSVRMVVASFLVEYLRVNWVRGAKYFAYTLVDTDSAINSMMWQNAGRSGIDQWNFVMSPVAASQDASGEYTKKWCPELSKLPKSVLHKPWEAPEQVLMDAGVRLGENYPTRIITDLKAERAKSVESVLAMRRANQEANSERGYDMIRLPDGKRTVVFTKKEFRIDGDGVVIKEATRPKKAVNGGRGKGRGGGRGRKGTKAAQKKLLRQEAAMKK